MSFEQILLWMLGGLVLSACGVLVLAVWSLNALHREETRQ